MPAPAITKCFSANEVSWQSYSFVLLLLFSSYYFFGTTQPEQWEMFEIISFHLALTFFYIEGFFSVYLEDPGPSNNKMNNHFSRNE